MDLVAGPGGVGAATVARDLHGSPVSSSGSVGSYRDSDVENLIHITSVLRDAVLVKDPISLVKKELNEAQIKFAFANASEAVLKHQPQAT